MTIEANITARKTATILMDLGFDLVKDNSFDAVQTRHFWHCVRQSIDELIGKEEQLVDSKPLKLEVDALDDFAMPFGAFKGSMMSDVPLWHCRWLIKQDWIDEWPDVAEWLEHNIGDDE